MRSSSLEPILSAIGESRDEPVRVSGTEPVSQSWILAQYFLTQSRNLLVLCADEDALSEQLSNLTAFLAMGSGESRRPIFFPDWDQSPYSVVSPSLRTRHRRLAALGRLRAGAESGGGKILLTTLSAANRTTLSPEVFEKKNLRLVKGGALESRDSVVGLLQEAGYLKIDPVEDPGTFSVRGEIIDVFPPGFERPVRIELFDDEIERIRSFDPDTQRADAKGDLSELSIYPAREVIIDRESEARLRTRLKSYADDLGISRKVRDPILESIREGLYPDHSDVWGPFAFESPSTLWDYIDDSFQIVWLDEIRAMQKYDQFLEEQKIFYDRSLESDLILPRVDALYGKTPTHEAGRLVYLDRIEMADLGEVPRESGEEEETEAGAGRGSLQVLVKPNSDFVSPPDKRMDEVASRIHEWMEKEFEILIFASTKSQMDRLKYLLKERNLKVGEGGLSILQGALNQGIRWPAIKKVFLTDSDLLGRKGSSSRVSAGRGEKESAGKRWSNLQGISDLSPGDAIVHIDHGIGVYQGLVRLNLAGSPSDFIALEYADNDKLYLPVYRLDLIQKYVGGKENTRLDRLGTKNFEKTKSKVRDAVKKLAFDLVDLYAKRELQRGYPFAARDSGYQEFEAKFPFEETPDQIRAIEECLGDLESGKVVDRLVCGDVGFGKTEVAMRAAFQAVMSGKQVAVLVPTTVLALQHDQSFTARFKDYPIRVESVSRFKSRKEQKEVVEDLASGKVDILIGTHRLLSKDVKFDKLGLVIVDEEHRFGVEHKERLKTMKLNTHVITLTATPIPRTLHMSLSGLRDISLISTPPVNRLPIRTFVSKFDEELIKRAIEFELSRGGQVLFLHNRVQSIERIASRIRALVPSAKIGIGHGQMGEKTLEKVMMDFYHKETNVLVCTTIIESGLDIPSANTLIVDRADSFGLAQLYQIRGRVGRSHHRAYCYLLISETGHMTDDARKRLEVIQRFVELGSGFQVATYDLEIRGGGNLLGPQQSGHIASVGFELYTELLQEAISEVRGEEKDAAAEELRGGPEIKSSFPAFLDENYIPDVHQRLSIYRKLSSTRTVDELQLLEEELQDRYGKPPEEAQNLLALIQLKQLLSHYHTETLTIGASKVTLRFQPTSTVRPEAIIEAVTREPSRFKITPDSKLIVGMETKGLMEITMALEKILGSLTGAG